MWIDIQLNTAKDGNEWGFTLVPNNEGGFDSSGPITNGSPDHVSAGFWYNLKNLVGINSGAYFVHTHPTNTTSAGLEGGDMTRGDESGEDTTVAVRDGENFCSK